MSFILQLNKIHQWVKMLSPFFLSLFVIMEHWNWHNNEFPTKSSSVQKYDIYALICNGKCADIKVNERKKKRAFVTKLRNCLIRLIHLAFEWAYIQFCLLCFFCFKFPIELLNQVDLLWQSQIIFSTAAAILFLKEQQQTQMEMSIIL